ncbi:hypothetical protein [Streptomyces sp. NPDC020681]|uniref:hypothetical protein n=1 Tax=Streptomyces sp. NPDC020681 TaxID=3365083 RepID=UPI0037A6BF81
MSKNSGQPRGSCTSCTRCGRRLCAVWQGPQRIARFGRSVLTYRFCLRRSVAALVVVAALLVAGGVSGALLPTGAAAVVVTLAWMVSALRVLRLDAAAPGPGGGPGGDGAGVREPRRPRPGRPSDIVSLPLPEDPPGGSSAIG